MRLATTVSHVGPSPATRASATTKLPNSTPTPGSTFVTKPPSSLLATRLALHTLWPTVASPFLHSSEANASLSWYGRSEKAYVARTELAPASAVEEVTTSRRRSSEASVPSATGEAALGSSTFSSHSSWVSRPGADRVGLAASERGTPGRERRVNPGKMRMTVVSVLKGS